MSHQQTEAPVTRWRIGGDPRRVEDHRLLRGLGRYDDDIIPTGALHAVFVCSPHGAARIAAIDIDAGRAVPGVVAPVTGSQMPRPPWHALPTDAARHIGDAVTMVVATSLVAARSGAEAVAVDWEPLPTVADAAAALKPSAPHVWWAA